jgi:hypothetical protein
MNSNTLNKLFQILIVCFLFPLGVGSGFYYLFKPSDTVTDKVFVGEDNFSKVKTEIKTGLKPQCQLPIIKSTNTNIEYADNGDSWVRLLDIMPISDGAYMEITLDSPGAINFERYFANTSESFATMFCTTTKDKTSPVAVSVFFGPQSKPGKTLDYKKLYKIGTFTGNKMYFSIPIDQDVYVSTDNDVLPKGKIDLIGK